MNLTTTLPAPRFQEFVCKVQAPAATNPLRVTVPNDALSDMMQEAKQSEANAGSGMRALWPSCRQVSRLQSAATLQRLSLGQHLGLRFHLLVCSWCRRYGKRIGFLRTFAQEHEHKHTVPTPHALSPNARERMKRSLQDREK